MRVICQLNVPLREKNLLDLVTSVARDYPDVEIHRTFDLGGETVTLWSPALEPPVTPEVLLSVS